MTQPPSQDDDPEQPSPVVGTSRPNLLKVLGPGLITGASDDDPSGIATYSQVGARYGYAMGWTMVISYPLMVAIQIISARIGRTTGHGIAGILRLHYPTWLLAAVVMMLLAANIINLGADLGAMADALTLLLPAPHVLYVVLMAVICISMQLFLEYTRYVAVLKWLTLALFAYFGTLAIVHVDWAACAWGLVWPGWPWDRDMIVAVVAVLGTTISPYLFFWQASEEVEDMHVYPQRTDLYDAPSQGRRALHRIEIDTLVGMGFSNLVALAIIITTAATLHPSGILKIETSAQAAEALRPLAGRLASGIFTLGIVGTGLLAVPVLAGSAAYAVGEMRRWPMGLARRPKEAQAFYAVLVIATLIGMILNFTPINPIRALYWSAVINGVTSVPVMMVMMLLASRRDIMGPFAVRGTLRVLGWLATGVMAAIVVAMFVTL
ncbi:divalent metal cation transporter [Gluconacetobacter azotocaptans]|uniref:Divalent metal cation transporter n=1 Tax=Gluconacetobacter azotocaptans TaxID=142834 RepID=A0A7W4PF35_9PROT|nr:divalent metal cation transporter [Gluconacetobacter azotocaptans]MBB2188491.1 divalent metal cation transporter [Gluconacetobacter azotocaptans]MBM9400196.1 divalent metal cation transporter [Gluconacetobacter azotocaptans]GBQ27988.1 Mn2+/Fe2+ transporter [Gluconacetobacter azotocaptans DSM 13594]